MLGDDEVKEMQEEISAMEEELRERKRELHDKRYAGLRTAMEARKAADIGIMEELKSLGIRTMRGGWTF
tara:strand:- start:635 stop:841 length:207 start_codon:yes stop_codon:yes gene_type:complete